MITKCKFDEKKDIILKEGYSSTTMQSNPKGE